jgi:hypothetical protein
MFGMGAAAVTLYVAEPVVDRSGGKDAQSPPLTSLSTATATDTGDGVEYRDTTLDRIIVHRRPAIPTSELLDT